LHKQTDKMWEDLELDPERIPMFKLVFHSAQILFAFVSWCLGIAVFRNDEARIVGNNGWTFGVVCCLEQTSETTSASADRVTLPVLPLDTGLDLPDDGPPIPTHAQDRPAARHVGG
jgi:hypothetical protein